MTKLLYNFFHFYNSEYLYFIDIPCQNSAKFRSSGSEEEVDFVVFASFSNSCHLVPRRHFCFVSSCFFSHCSIHCCCFCLACDSSIVATCPSIQLPALLFVCVLFVLFLLFVVLFLVNQSRTKGESWSTKN